MKECDCGHNIPTSKQEALDYEFIDECKCCINCNCTDNCRNSWDEMLYSDKNISEGIKLLE